MAGSYAYHGGSILTATEIYRTGVCTPLLCLPVRHPKQVLNAAHPDREMMATGAGGNSSH